MQNGVDNLHLLFGNYSKEGATYQHLSFCLCASVKKIGGGGVGITNEQTVRNDVKVYKLKPLGITLKNTFHFLCAFVILHQLTSLADTCRLSLEDETIMELSLVEGLK